MSKVVWLAPSPLWDDLLPLGTTRFRAPALLRFATDRFMEEFQGRLAARPRELTGYVARHETWRRPAVGLETTAAAKTLKLYQPIHGRFYLVTASLACRTPGLPEHTVDLAAAESVTFVLRRVTAGGELAWVTNGDGVQGWSAAQAHALAPGEETLPMFPSNFAADDLTRRVFAGLVPVGRREAYVGARSITPAAGTDGSTGSAPAAAANPLEDARVIEFQRAVLEPWVSLRDWHYRESVAVPSRAANANIAAEHASALILLDFATYLQEELPAVWQAIKAPAQAGALPAAQKALYDALDVRLWKSNASAHVPLRQALIDADTHRDLVENMALPAHSGPGPIPQAPTVPAGVTAVLLTGDPRVSGLPAATQALIAADEAKIADLLERVAAPPYEAGEVGARKLKRLVVQALGSLPAAAAATSAALSGGARVPMMEPLNARGDDLYVVRCVYQRPQCGRRYTPLISAASVPFQLASFFDADAPQRPVRVALPIDTSPGALRKYDKNVGFLLSNELRKQMSRVKGMKELMDGDVQGASGLDISVICSMSIPIITICALILLMIIVGLLNFIFWWIPFLMVCFPVPSLKAKS